MYSKKIMKLFIHPSFTLLILSDLDSVLVVYLFLRLRTRVTHVQNDFSVLVFISRIMNGYFETVSSQDESAS